MIIESLIIVGLFGAILVFIGTPLFSASHQLHSKEYHLADLHLKKQDLLADLKDLEFDHQLQKVSDSDFNQFKEKGLIAGAEILEAIETIKKPTSL